MTAEELFLTKAMWEQMFSYLCAFNHSEGGLNWPARAQVIFELKSSAKPLFPALTNPQTEVQSALSSRGHEVSARLLSWEVDSCFQYYLSIFDASERLKFASTTTVRQQINCTLTDFLTEITAYDLLRKMVSDIQDVEIYNTLSIAIRDSHQDQIRGMWDDIHKGLVYNVFLVEYIILQDERGEITQNKAVEVANLTYRLTKFILEIGDQKVVRRRDVLRGLLIAGLVLTETEHPIGYFQ